MSNGNVRSQSRLVNTLSQRLGPGAGLFLHKKSHPKAALLSSDAAVRVCIPWPVPAGQSKQFLLSYQSSKRLSLGCKKDLLDKTQLA